MVDPPTEQGSLGHFSRLVLEHRGGVQPSSIKWPRRFQTSNGGKRSSVRFSGFRKSWTWEFRPQLEVKEAPEQTNRLSFHQNQDSKKFIFHRRSKPLLIEKFPQRPYSFTSLTSYSHSKVLSHPRHLAILQRDSRHLWATPLPWVTSKFRHSPRWPVAARSSIDAKKGFSRGVTPCIFDVNYFHGG